MSTISRIAMKQDDGTYKSIYCHSDGYLEHNGAILYTYYIDKSKVEDLIKLGDISKLGKEVSPDSSKPHNFKERQDDVTVAYHRDRGEKFHSKDFLTREELIKRNYIFNPLKENINKRKEVSHLLVEYIKRVDPYKFSLYFGTEEFAFDLMNGILSSKNGIEDTMEKLYSDIHKFVHDGGYNDEEMENLSKEALSLMLEVNKYSYTLYEAEEFEMER